MVVAQPPTAWWEDAVRGSIKLQRSLVPREETQHTTLRRTQTPRMGSRLTGIPASLGAQQSSQLTTLALPLCWRGLPSAAFHTKQAAPTHRPASAQPAPGHFPCPAASWKPFPVSTELHMLLATATALPDLILTPSPQENPT